MASGIVFVELVLEEMEYLGDDRYLLAEGIAKPPTFAKDLRTYKQLFRICGKILLALVLEKFEELLCNFCRFRFKDRFQIS